MSINLRKRAALSFAAVVGLSVLAAACSQPKPPPPKPVAPPVALAPSVLDQAGGYYAYVKQAGAISPKFANGGDVAQSLKAGAAFEPRQFLRGAIAYGAVAALQDPTYVAGIRKYASDPQQRRDMAAQILRNPHYVTSLPGADSAAALVVAALANEGERLYANGKAVKQAAYDVQHQAWSKAEVANRAGRLAEAKALSAAPRGATSAELNLLGLAVTGATPLGLSGRSAPGAQSPVVVRSLAVAALAALGEAGEPAVDNINALMVDPASTTCLNMSKLNLYQCLAVSKPHYEDVFCLGQHVLIDTGQCLIRSAGLPPPEPYKPVKIAETDPPAKPAAKPAKKKR